MEDALPKPPLDHSWVIRDYRRGEGYYSLELERKDTDKHGGRGWVSVGSVQIFPPTSKTDIFNRAKSLLVELEFHDYMSELSDYLKTKRS